MAVAEEGAVGRAARRLHVSQPPLSRRIAGLEAELGQPLFRRTARGMELLDAGHELLGRAKEILSRVEDARSALRAHSSIPGRAPPGLRHAKRGRADEVDEGD